MARLLRDRYFWFIITILVISIIFLYPADSYFQGWLPPQSEGDLAYMAFQHVVFLLLVAIAAWKFGVKGGMVACLAVGLIVLPYVLTKWQQGLLIEYLLMGAIAISLSRLIGNYKKEKQLRQELEKQIKQRIEFTRALVHELKTPLTPILAASELLMAEVQEEPWQSLATKINRGALSLVKRIDELFDMARGEIGMLKLSCKSVDSRSLLQGVFDYVSAEASNHKQSLILDLPPSLHSVWADEDRLQQVLLNLLNNAFKFTPEGGKITLKAVEKDGNLIVEVQDTGCGMIMEEQRRLFKSYHLPGVDTEHPSGLGLGLALCKSLVELHGGQIWVKSRKGKGSTFGFSMPYEREE